MAEENVDNNDDLARVEGFLQERVKEYFAEEVKNFKQSETVNQSNTVNSTPDDPHKALREYINPVIQPELQRVRVEAANSADLIKVMNDPMYAEYKDEVEQVFNNLVKEGRPFSRVDILNHVMGKEYRENRDKFKERTEKVQREQLSRASYGSDVGGGSIGRGGDTTTKFPDMDDFRKMPSSEQAKWLEGVTF